MGALLGRNIKLFFRDKTQVFFSLLAVIIILTLHAVFLGDTITIGYEDVTGIEYLMDSWVIASILSVISMTATLGAFSVMVEDRARKAIKDFLVSPLRRNALPGAYFINAILVGIVMSLIALLIGEVYIVSSGGEWISFTQLAQVLAGVVVSTVSSGAIMFFMVSFLRSIGAFTAASTVVGTLIGFLVGAYIPIGILPESVQNVMRVFPTSYSASYFRTIMMEHPFEVAFDGAPDGAVEQFKERFGVHYILDGEPSTLELCIAVMAVTAVVFYVLAMLNITRKRRTV